MKRGMIHWEFGKKVVSRREMQPPGFICFVPIDENGNEFFDLDSIEIIEVKSKDNPKSKVKKAVINQDKRRNKIAIDEMLREKSSKENEQKNNRDRILKDSLDNFDNLTDQQKDDLLKIILERIVRG